MLQHLPSSSCPRRQRYQVSLLPLSNPPPGEESTKTKQSCLDSGDVAIQVSIIGRTVTLPHHLPFHFCIHRQQHQYGCPSLSPLPPLVITLGVLCCVAHPVALHLVPVLPRHEQFHRFDDSPIPLATLLSHPGR